VRFKGISTKQPIVFFSPDRGPMEYEKLKSLLMRPYVACSKGRGGGSIVITNLAETQLLLRPSDHSSALLWLLFPHRWDGIRDSDLTGK
ncbi:hypothetical protein L249_1716, partial [Ophiocordyceps polyrhachis-furcata BCC 54312]